MPGMLSTGICRTPSLKQVRPGYTFRIWLCFLSISFLMIYNTCTCAHTYTHIRHCIHVTQYAVKEAWDLKERELNRLQMQVQTFVKNIMMHSSQKTEHSTVKFFLIYCNGSMQAYRWDSPLSAFWWCVTARCRGFWDWAHIPSVWPLHTLLCSQGSDFLALWCLWRSPMVTCPIENFTVLH